VLSRNLLPFCLVSLVASLPNILVYAPTGIAPDRFDVWSGVGVVRAMLFALSQAAVLHAAVDDMRGRPVNLIESLKLGLRRSFPVLGVAICVLILAALGAVALFFLALMVMVFVAVPACVVERLGPVKSMERSARLTKGHRWKVFGLWIATLIVGLIVESVLSGLLAAVGGAVVRAAVLLVWSAVLSAFSAILAVVTYHDLRVAKEGIDSDETAAVFD
jgi:hypothetical protein